MTIVRFLILLTAADVAFLFWLGWWLNRTPKRGGYIANRWRR